MKALVAGAGGQLARAWIAAAPPGWAVTGLGRAELDIGDEAAVSRAVARLSPDLVLNAAAHTAVDRAESEPGLAFRINRDGARHLAEAARRAGARLAHISTDFVFDGRSARPWRPDDPTGPLNVYGASKLAGEQAVAAADPGALIVRTAWVYGPDGTNFLTTMLRLMQTRPELAVVDDQVGTPTSTPSLATALWGLIGAGATGVWHATDAGQASWCAFAQAIAQQAAAAGLIARAPPVRPIRSLDYPTAAVRPAYSVLDCTATDARLGRPAPHWRDALNAVISGMAER